MRVKNNSGATKTWAGMQLSANQEYDIEQSELHSWQASDDVISDLTSGDLLIGTAFEYKPVGAAAVSFLFNENATPTDSDGSPLQRIKVTQSGWNYQLIGVEIETSTTDGVYAYDPDGNSLSYFSYKMYDANGDETTTPANCVKTVVDFEPPFDYEIVGGGFRQKTVPNTELYYSVIGVPDIPAAYGGSKVFVQAIDISFLNVNTELKADGRAPKKLIYDANNHTNKLRFVVLHDAGIQHKFLQTIEIFRP